MTISSNALFHFTSYKNLLSILEEKHFRVRYTKETIDFRPPLSLYIPMVCFCDIPLTLTREHINEYDGYAIGLKKEWAIGHGLNPVFYINEIGMTVTFEGLNFGSSFLPEGKNAFNHMLCFVKQYKGKNNKCPKQKEKLFYNEKEWRHVPMLSNFTDAYQQFYMERDFPDGLNDKIIGHRLYDLPFNISNVDYLILKSKSERTAFIDYLKKTDYSEAVQNHAIKIFSTEEIFQDF